MPKVAITLCLEAKEQKTLNSLIHTVDLMTLPPSGREDWTREIKVERDKP